ISIFSSEPGLVDIAGTFLRIATTGYIIMGLVAVLAQSLTGIGDTMPPLFITLISSWGIQMPLAYFLPRITELDVYGIRWAIVIGIAARAIAYIIYFRMGRWKHKRV
ncbi:MAG: MATE family efflux transporter, partial [Dehalococcoidales bacterium]|nr:MATE family efflux transporter [Dehalococcoidales bacterium]